MISGLSLGMTGEIVGRFDRCLRLLMKVGDLIRRRRGAACGRLGIVAKRGVGKCFIAWIDGGQNWCVLSMLEVVHEGG